MRLRIDEGLVERLSGDSQFGHGFDRWGHYFTNDNANHARHEVIAARHLARNPDLLVPTSMQDIPDHGSAARVFPITKRPTFELLTEAGQFTSACAITPYEGGAFHESDGTSLFVAEPVHNLVHRDVLAPDGATFVARRSHESREFLAAGDSWFRPVFLYVGPDGSLHVVDYYRARIEHPEWSASDLQRNPAPLYAGQDRGRIYRIAREGVPPPRRPVALGSASDESLVAELSNPNLWWRRTAQRLLVDRKARGAEPALRATAAGPSAVGRVHALWTLEGLGLLDAPLVLRALGDPEPGVRENAVRLAEARVTDAPALGERLIAIEGDPDPRVRFAVLAALGSVAGNPAAAARDRMLLSAIDDRWMQAAALSAAGERATDIFAGATAPGSPVLGTATPGRGAFLEQAAAMVAARGGAAGVRAVVERVSGPHAAGDAWWRAASLRGLALGVRGHDNARVGLAGLDDPVLALHEDEAGEVRQAAFDLLRLGAPHQGPRWRSAVDRAVSTANRQDADPGRRADAVALVSLDAPARRVPWFLGFLSPHEPETVQLEAAQALGRVPPGNGSATIGRALLDRWAGMSPAVRSEAAGVLLGDRTCTGQLLEAMRAGRVQAWTLDFWQKRDLVMHEDAGVRAEARALLEEDPRQRAATVKRYAAALDLAGDASRGREVFGRVCAACHRLGREPGGDLGPDLATVRHRPPLGLLGDILVPSQSIAQHYETYIVVRRGGGTAAGVLGAQTPDTITLRQGQGQAVTIRRADIRSMAAAPQSSMPADLDKVVTPPEMADLLAYIRGQ